MCKNTMGSKPMEALRGHSSIRVLRLQQLASEVYIIGHPPASCKIIQVETALVIQAQ